MHTELKSTVLYVSWLYLYSQLAVPVGPTVHVEGQIVKVRVAFARMHW
jgi:hypothetical protein